MPMSDNGAIIVVYRNCLFTLVENRQSTFCSYLCEGYLGTILCLLCVIVPSNYTLNVSNFPHRFIHQHQGNAKKLRTQIGNFTFQSCLVNKPSDLNCEFSMSSFVMLICYGLHFGHA